MGSYISSFKSLFWNDSSKVEAKIDVRTFDEKAIEAGQEGFEYMRPASESSDLTIDDANDRILKTPQGQMYNAKGELYNATGHVAKAAGNAILAAGHGVAVALSVQNAFGAVTHFGGIVNEAKVILEVGVEAEDLLQKGKDFYDRLAGNPIQVHEQTNLSKAHDFVEGLDNVIHENTGYLTAGYNAFTTYLYPTNLVSLCSRTKGAIVNTYQAIKCTANAGAAIAKAVYYEAKDLIINGCDNSSADLSDDLGSNDIDLAGDDSAIDVVVA